LLENHDEDVNIESAFGACGRIHIKKDKNMVITEFFGVRNLNSIDNLLSMLSMPASACANRLMQERKIEMDTGWS